MSKIKRIISILAFLLLPACTQMHFEPGIAKPSSMITRPPEGPAEYQQGWSDGCETAMSGYGSPWTKMFYTARKDANYIGNAVYDQVWRDAYGYCRVQMKTAQLQGWGNYNNAFGIEAILPIPKIIDG